MHPVSSRPPSISLVAQGKRPETARQATSSRTTSTSSATGLSRKRSTRELARSTPGEAGGSDEAKVERVSVCVRVKPPMPSSALYECDATSITLSDQHPAIVRRGMTKESLFSFDHVHLPPRPTLELFDNVVRPIVVGALDGFDATVFAYGQTGSGKTYTMGGVPGDPGVIFRVIEQLFQATASEGRAYALSVSYLELYNEQLRDLLDQDSKETPTIHEADGRVFVKNVREVAVSTAEEIEACVARGEASRRVGKTEWNERSSRSHSILSIIIESHALPPVQPDDLDPLKLVLPPTTFRKDSRLSRLNLCDLAGSEKATADKSRQTEGGHINQSLLALSNVISTIIEARPGAHVPYRSSQLTRLLQNSLSGRARVAVIATVSFDEIHTSEALSTLRFAQRVSKVVTKAERGKIAQDKSLLHIYETKISDLELQVAELASERAQIAGFKEEFQRREAVEAALRQQIESYSSLILSPKRSRTLKSTAISPAPAGPPLPTPAKVLAGPSPREISLEVEIARLRSLLRDQETEHEEIVSPLWSNCANLDAENKTLRARVAELENYQAKLEFEREDQHKTIRDSLASRADLIASLAAHQSTITALELKVAEASAKVTVSKSERTVLKAQLAEASATREADSKEILSLRLQVQSYQGNPFSNDQIASKLGRLSGLEAKMEALRSKQKQPGGPVSSTSALIPPNSMDRLYFHLHLIPDLDAEGKSSVLPSRDKIERLLAKEAKRILNGTEDVQIIYCVTSPLSQPGIVASFVCKSSLFDDQPPPKSLKEWEQALLERATREWSFKCVPRLAGVMVGRRERASC